MSNKPLVSVLMTSYNRELYIGAAIESVLISTYQNFELIIVDDQSRDSTVDIVRSYERKDHRIKLFVNEANLGDYPNRNRAASYAKGKYLKYVDADDLIYPYGLEQLVYFMEQYPEAGYGLCSLPAKDNQPYPILLSPEEAYKWHYFDMGIFNKAPLSSIVKKEVFNSIGGFSGKRWVGDFELWHILSSFTNVLLMQQGIVWSRIHQQQESVLNRIAPSVPFRYYLIAEEMLNKPNCPLKKEDKTKAIRMIRKNISKYIFYYLRNKGPAEAFRLLELSPHNLINTIKHLFH
jgi:glycosyltransferase involved in cell wall biosynthesis